MSGTDLLDGFDLAALPGASTREAAAARVRAGGWPTKRDEAWHYTDLAAGLRGFALGPAPAVEVAAELPEGPRVVFVNGRFDAARSAAPDWVSQLGDAAADPARGGVVVALNTALAEDGVAITLAPGQQGGTLFLVALAAGRGETMPAIAPRHRIVLGAGATLTLIETARGEGSYLHAPVFEVDLGAGARLNHYRLQDESAEAVHVATIFAEIAGGAGYESFTLNRGARLSRNETHARLTGPAADVHLNAAQLLAGTQHGDVTTVVRHDAPDCASRQTVKSVLAGAARGVFQGRIEVDRIAQKTDGYQMNQALLLSDEAEIDSKPELEIFADDVKCSHGATIGALDPEQLFYLRSRGVPAAEAKSILIRAFLDEALEPVTDEAARAVFEAAIGAWWREGA
ncbi:MAG: Fe-S cluster assembly protein SufD [Rhodospirillales bacterium]|nr:Fe-S cluster assembly protein SufD [Rhodospirillales bacterium]